MPQNKPMKIQWITVNGRQVPLVLPQTYSYKDDDWKITSDQDLLFIVEYGTTAGGIVVPKRVSDEGHELTQLTGSFITNDKPIPIKEQKPIGSKEILILKSATERGSSIPASTEDVIYEHIGSTIIDTLEFAVGNKMNVLLRIYRRNGENWERISLLTKDGAGRVYF